MLSLSPGSPGGDALQPEASQVSISSAPTSTMPPPLPQDARSAIRGNGHVCQYLGASGGSRSARRMLPGQPSELPRLCWYATLVLLSSSCDGDSLPQASLMPSLIPRRRCLSKFSQTSLLTGKALRAIEVSLSPWRAGVCVALAP